MDIADPAIRRGLINKTSRIMITASNRAGTKEDNISRKEAISRTISNRADISKAAAERALTSALGAVMKAVSKGDRVTLVGFGTFYATKRAARLGQNPRTGEKIKIAAATVPKFSAGAAFKEAANKKRK